MGGKNNDFNKSLSLSDNTSEDKIDLAPIVHAEKKTSFYLSNPLLSPYDHQVVEDDFEDSNSVDEEDEVVEEVLLESAKDSDSVDEEDSDSIKILGRGMLAVAAANDSERWDSDQARFRSLPINSNGVTEEEKAYKAAITVPVHSPDVQEMNKQSTFTKAMINISLILMAISIFALPLAIFLYSKRKNDAIGNSKTNSIIRTENPKEPDNGSDCYEFTSEDLIKNITNESRTFLIASNPNCDDNYVFDDCDNQATAIDSESASNKFKNKNN